MDDAEKAKAKAEADVKATERWDARFKEASTGLTSWPNVCVSMGLDVFKEHEKIILKVAAKHRYNLTQTRKPLRGTIVFINDFHQSKSFQETYEYITKGNQ